MNLLEGKLKEMRLFPSLNTYSDPHPVVLSIGKFDGLHRGHQYLLQKNMDLAVSKGARAVVLSFHPHPMKLLKPESFTTLASLADQEQGLEQLGIDDWVQEPFTEETREESPESFLNRLKNHLPLQSIVVGPDFRFGKDRQGGKDLLLSWGKSHQIEIVLPEPYLYHGQRVSSSLIRQSLQQGDVELAAELLGHPFFIRGKVTSGFRRGRQIGFPTANIHSAQASHLHRGVYNTRIFLRGEKWKAATNVGLHPTFGEDLQLQIEAHLLDFEDNIYGEEIRIDFLSFLRPELKFPDVEALKLQIAKDVHCVRES